MKPTVGNAGISLRQRLLMLTLLTSGIGLLVGCGAILIFDLQNAKKQNSQGFAANGGLDW